MYIFWTHNLLDFQEDIHHDEYSMLLDSPFLQHQAGSNLFSLLLLHQQSLVPDRRSSQNQAQVQDLPILNWDLVLKNSIQNRIEIEFHFVCHHGICAHWILSWKRSWSSVVLLSILSMLYIRYFCHTKSIAGMKSCASAWLEHWNESVPEFVKWYFISWQDWSGCQ